MYYRLWTAVLTAVLFSAATNAQPALSGNIQLGDAMAATLEYNPALTSFPLREEALLGQRQTADLRPPLRFNTEAENVFGTGSLNGIEGSETGISLSGVVELGDKRAARVGISDTRLELLQTQQRVTELDLLAEVTFRFIEVAAAQERLELQQRATALAQQTRDSLEDLVTAGQAPALERDRASAALNRAQVAEQEAETAVESARTILSSMWGRQVPAFASVTAELPAVGEAGSLNNILIDLETNPDILLFASERRLLQAQLQEARTRRRADVQWSAGIRHLQGVNDTGFALSFSVPLNTESRARGAIAEARANLAEVETRRATALNQMRAQLYALHNRLGQAILEVTTLQQEVLPQLANVLQQSVEAYQSGRYSYLELVSAQQEYLDAELTLIQSAANAHTLRTEIERLSGAPLQAQSPEVTP